jgi:FlaG/FlaF family flagellin (archaellin)
VKRAAIAAALSVLLATQSLWADGPAPAAPTPTPAAPSAPATTEPATPKRPLIEDPAGTPVTFTSNDVTMRAYLAHGDIRGEMVPDPFEKLPPLPCTVKLAPGMYTVEAESPNASTGHDHITVEHDSPIKVEIRSGNASVKAFGGVFIAIGIVAVVLGIVSFISISPNDGNFNRWGVGGGLLGGGLGLGGLGIGMTIAGATNIVSPHVAPGRAAPVTTGTGLALTYTF